MRLTTKGRFAVTALLDLAMQRSTRPVTLAEISQRQQISLSYLEQLFAKLRQRALVDSVRGPGGGLLHRQGSCAGIHCRDHPRRRRADRFNAMQWQGELPQRQEMHDARSVDKAQRSYFRSSWCGEFETTCRRTKSKT